MRPGHQVEPGELHGTPRVSSMDERNLSTVARAAASTTTDSYVAALQAAAPGQIAAVYAVGSLALGDFSDRQSNIDLVVVADPGLDGTQLDRVAGAARGLRRAHRDAQVWHVAWEDLDANGPGAG